MDVKKKLVTLGKNPDLIPSTHRGSQPYVTPISEDSMAPSDFHRHKHERGTHTNKQNTHKII